LSSWRCVNIRQVPRGFGHRVTLRDYAGLLVDDLYPPLRAVTGCAAVGETRVTDERIVVNFVTKDNGMDKIGQPSGSTKGGS
jgi:hypothetical protein